MNGKVGIEQRLHQAHQQSSLHLRNDISSLWVFEAIHQLGGQKKGHEFQEDLFQWGMKMVVSLGQDGSEV